MAARGPYKTRRIGSFKRDLQATGKKRFKKNAAGADRLFKLVEELEEAIRVDPFAAHYGSGKPCTTEGFPNGYARQGCIFRKLRFKVPALNGSAALGRILFEVDSDEGVITFLAFYTHDDYAGDYAANDLVDRLTEQRPA